MHLNAHLMDKYTLLDETEFQIMTHFTRTISWRDFYPSKFNEMDHQSSETSTVISRQCEFYACACVLSTL